MEGTNRKSGFPRESLGLAKPSVLNWPFGLGHLACRGGRLRGQRGHRGRREPKAEGCHSVPVAQRRPFFIFFWVRVRPMFVFFFLGICVTLGIGVGLRGRRTDHQSSSLGEASAEGLWAAHAWVLAEKTTRLESLEGPNHKMLPDTSLLYFHKTQKTAGRVPARGGITPHLGQIPW